MNTDTVLVDRNTLQILLDYVANCEYDDYQMRLSMAESVEGHVYSLVYILQDCINSQ